MIGLPGAAEALSRAPHFLLQTQISCKTKSDDVFQADVSETVVYKTTPVMTAYAQQGLAQVYGWKAMLRPVNDVNIVRETSFCHQSHIPHILVCNGQHASVFLMVFVSALKRSSLSRFVRGR